MPTYEYECERCGVIEVEQKLSDPPLTTCNRFAAQLPDGQFPVTCDRCKKTGSLPGDCLLVTNAIACSCSGTRMLDYCNGAVRRLIPSSTNFILQGKGWAKDGYK